MMLRCKQMTVIFELIREDGHNPTFRIINQGGGDAILLINQNEKKELMKIIPFYQVTK